MIKSSSKNKLTFHGRNNTQILLSSLGADYLCLNDSTLWQVKTFSYLNKSGKKRYIVYMLKLLTIHDSPVFSNITKIHRQ